MKLYEDARAPNPRRVRIFLAEKGIQVASEPLEIMSLGHKTDAFRSLNPVGTMPVLELDDGTVLTESVAICRYFEALHPAPPLMGEGALDAALVEMWQRRCELYFFWPVAQSVRHLHPRFDTLEKPQVAAWGEANKARIPDAIAMLDARLADSRFIAGDDFTIADITAIVATEFMRIARVAVPDSATNFIRWWEDVSSRPSVAGKE